MSVSSAQVELTRETYQNLNSFSSALRNPKGSSTTNDYLFEYLNRVFDSIVDISQIKGFSAAMLLPDGQVWKRASGPAQELPYFSNLSTDHLLGIGSTTKSYTSTALLLLYEDGLLSLDDPIGMYLDPYPHIDENITVRQLLSHRSGIYEYMADSALMSKWQTYPDSIWITDTILHNYLSEPYFVAGEEWSYTNTNYLLIGRIIEKIMNRPWYQVVRERVLFPFELTHTFCLPFESLGDHSLSHCWARIDSTGDFKDIIGSGFLIDGLFSLASSAGCIVSTPEDLVHFHKYLYGGHILKTSSLEEMKTDYTNDELYFLYGLGTVSFKNMGLDNWGHDGSLIYKCNALYFPDEDMALAVLQNDNRSRGYIRYYDVFDVLLDAYLNFGKIDPNDDIGIFPNPTNGRCIIIISDNTSFNYPISCTIINSTGQQVHSFKLAEGNREINITGIPEGIYFLQIGEFIKKVVIAY